MGAALFYHLTRRPLEATLPLLLEKARAADWRVAVRGVDRARMAWLDEKLWLGAEDSFLPHGLAEQPHAEDQPVLLTTDTALPNAPQCLMSVDGAAVDPAEVARMARVCVLFDGGDEAAVQTARAQWRRLTSAGCTAQYWSESSGKWQMMAER